MPKPEDKPNKSHHVVDLNVNMVGSSGGSANINELKALMLAFGVTLNEVLKQGETMATALEALTAEVARDTEVNQSAIILLQGLAAKIEELKNQPAALQKLADDLRASQDALAAAVAANTPAEEAPPAEPPADEPTV